MTGKMLLTGGGRFDPSEDFIYFTAGSPGAYEHERIHPWTLVATNDLCKSGPDPALDAILENDDHKLLFDSGVFALASAHARKYDLSINESLAVAPEAIDGFDALYARYVEVVRLYEARFWGYVEVDQGPTEQKKRTRAKLERAGLRPIPVYHPLSDGWEYFDELAKKYDRICIGNLAATTATVRTRLLAALWERKRRKYRHLWIHALGLTPNESVSAYPVNSCDSSSWNYAIRFGAPSAPGPFAQLKTFGKFGHAHSYDQLVAASHERGVDASMRFQVSQSSFRQMIWRQSQADVRELLSTTNWPPAGAREATPVPSPASRIEP